MAMRLRSLSDDTVDSYTHTWSVILFLLLAFILLVVPGQAPNNKTTPMPRQQQQQQQQQQQYRQYEAECWCPAFFTDSQKDYANSLCSTTFNSIMQGKNNSFASIYEVMSSNIPQNTNRDQIKPRDTNTNANNTTDNYNSEGEKQEGEEDLWSPLREWSPALLFLLAIALRLPAMVRTMFTGCCDGINVGGTLESAERGESMDAGARRQAYAGLATSLQNNPGAGKKKTTTCLYFTMKILMIVVVIVEIIVVTTLPNNQNNKAESKPTDVTNSEQDMMDPVYTCSFEVRKFAKLQPHEVQCIFVRRQDSQPKQIQTSRLDLNSARPSSVESSVFLVVLINLTVLLVVNVLNTMLWLIAMTINSTGDRLGVAKDSPLDLVLLVTMARTNLGVGVAHGLAQCLSAADQHTRVDRINPVEEHCQKV